MKQIHIGTSGYNYKHWKERFYPKEVPIKKWLEYYSEHFKTVEINATFYGSFRKEVYEAWREKTPKDFIIAIKGSRFITHVKRLSDIEEPTERFFAQAEGLKEKLGVILWQFPRSFNLKKSEDNISKLKKFIKILPKNIPQAFEFRHETMFSPEVLDILQKGKAGFVINDSSVFPEFEAATDGIVYIRFHGPGKLYTSAYSDSQLEEWSEKIKYYAKSREVFCYFNNDGFANAIKNAKALIGMI